MEESAIKKRYRIFILSIIIAMCGIIGIIYVYSIKNVSTIYKKHAQESIIDVKKSFLKDTVNNVIVKIEQKQREETDYYKELTNKTGRILRVLYSVSPNSFLDHCKEYFSVRNHKEAFIVLVLDQKTNMIIYDNTDSGKGAGFDERLKLLRASACSFHEEIYGDYKVFFAVSNEFIDNLTKIYIAQEIHGIKFSNDSYIWVNEVLNYEGGDNYAIRLIHPNLIDTEGCFLSTDMKDIKGNQPYLTELEGVKEHGEIFFNYYFKKKNSDVISEKLTYAKLYKKYHWIIAMGVHLDDIQSYVDTTAKDSESIISKMIVSIVLLTIGLYVVSLMSLLLLEKWYYTFSSRKLHEQINMDPLTNTFNRRAAINHLSEAFKDYKKGGISPAILIFDVDDFKRVNDLYGHDTGDSVLIKIVETVKSNIRITDRLFRWGGEEFLIICDGLKPDNAISFSNKLIDKIAKVEYGDEEHKYHVTVSIGAAYFEESDPDFNVAVKRADQALYRAKAQGKNCAFM